ncbi:MAG: type II toxin-antitoxin system YafQ family toxin [Candidatus Scalindua sp.]|nr:type II toxin-antitoxin system YafQ family toxin [Candidatus Scalindua sp.]MCR4345481.1 type II toxin-antitoxin system YafQ family toxin [Candidatus Scalindua sp.]
MITIIRTSQFKKDYKKSVKKRLNIKKLITVITQLTAGEKLPSQFKDHNLLGKYNKYRECHIDHDWLLIYQITEMELTLIRTGTHSELFE